MSDPKKRSTVALVGRPNAGKSTLINRILGQKVSIVSSKPQTTRNRIVGILNDERGQIVLLDTPGVHKPLPERFLAAELIREKVLIHTSDELPYTTAVAIDRYAEDEETNLISIYATVVVERDSQKGIVVGRQGSMIKKIGTEARLELE